MQYTISRNSPTSQFIQLKLKLFCQDGEMIHLQLPAWRPGRYELANYGQKIRGFKVYQNKKNIKWEKACKDLWQFYAEASGIYTIDYEFYANQLDGGGSWSDDRQLYLNFSNFIFEVHERKSEEIELKIILSDHFLIASALQDYGNFTFRATDFQHLIDSPILASPELQHFTYTNHQTTFHLWILGDIFFDVAALLKVFQHFTDAQIESFGNFPTENYHFIFHLLPYAHYHGVEHSFSTVITYGPAKDLVDKTHLDELIGVSSHELYHFWNVCRIRPKKLLPYDLSKEIYLNEGLVMEGITTYMGDYFLLKSSYFSLTDYLCILEKQIQKEFDSHGWQNQSIVDSSFDLWLDGYKAGIPSKKVSIYNRGALIALCLDLMLLDENSSLKVVMRKMWEEFGQTNKGYDLEDFEKLVHSYFSNRAYITEFFTDIVYGTGDLMDHLQQLLASIGVEIAIYYSDNKLLHHYGIATDDNGIIKQVHEKSHAYFEVMLGDKILNMETVTQPPFSTNVLASTIALTLDRAGRTIKQIIALGDGYYYPLYKLKLKTLNQKTKNWIG